MRNLKRNLKINRNMKLTKEIIEFYSWLINYASVKKEEEKDDDCELILKITDKFRDTFIKNNL